MNYLSSKSNVSFFLQKDGPNNVECRMYKVTKKVGKYFSVCIIFLLATSLVLFESIQNLVSKVCRSLFYVLSNNLGDLSSLKQGLVL